MSKPDYKNSDHKQNIKPNMKIQSILKLTRENPDMMYSWIRTDDILDPDGRFQQEYLDNGWEYTMDTMEVQHDYDSLKTKELSDKPSFYTRKGRGGAEFILVNKSKEQYLKDEAARVERDKNQYLASSKDQTVERKGNNVKITGSEINEKNMYK